MSSDAPSRDPRSQLQSAIQAATADDLDAALHGILAAAVDGLGASGGALLLADPDRAEQHVAAAIGLDAADALALLDAPDATVTPLVLGRGGVESTLGALLLRWPAGRSASPDDAATMESLAALAALAADRARHASNAAERSEWFERMAHTDPLTGIAN